MFVLKLTLGFQNQYKFSLMLGLFDIWFIWPVGFQDQYKFIYDSLEEYCRGIDSRFPVSDLANKIKEKTVKDKKIKKNAYAFEYAVRGLVALLPPCKSSSVWNPFFLPKSRSLSLAAANIYWQ